MSELLALRLDPNAIQAELRSFVPTLAAWERAWLPPAALPGRTAAARTAARTAAAGTAAAGTAAAGTAFAAAAAAGEPTRGVEPLLAHAAAHVCVGVERALLASGLAPAAASGALHLNRLVGCEEAISSPTYGLKGTIDAVATATLTDRDTGQIVCELPLPIELKTGQRTDSNQAEHAAQLLVYMLLLGELHHAAVPCGLLLYTQHVSADAPTRGVQLVAAEPLFISALMVARNRLVGAAAPNALIDERYPSPIGEPRECSRCDKLAACTLTHRAIEHGDGASFGAPELYNAHTSHLEPPHVAYLSRWLRLVDREERSSHPLGGEMVRLEAEEREALGRALADLVLIGIDKAPNDDPTRNEQWVHTFRRAVDTDASHGGERGTGGGGSGVGGGAAGGSSSGAGGSGSAAGGSGGVAGGNGSVRPRVGDAGLSVGDLVTISTEAIEHPPPVTTPWPVYPAGGGVRGGDNPGGGGVRGGGEAGRRPGCGPPAADARRVAERWAISRGPIVEANGDIVRVLLDACLTDLGVALCGPRGGGAASTVAGGGGAALMVAAPPPSAARQVLIRIDKCEIASSFNACRANLFALVAARKPAEAPMPIGHPPQRPPPAQLQPQALPPPPQASRTLRLVVDCAPPLFAPRDSALAALPPAEVERLRKLNGGQHEAVSRVLAAHDYALILGMPGTGKTTLIAAATRALVARGQRVLLSAYTHNAVDALLLKLVDEGVPFLRFGGSAAKVHPRVRPHTIQQIMRDAAATPADDGAPPPAGLVMERILHEMQARPVVATTALALNHPLITGQVRHDLPRSPTISHDLPRSPTISPDLP